MKNALINSSHTKLSIMWRQSIYTELADRDTFSFGFLFLFLMLWSWNITVDVEVAHITDEKNTSM